jgi:hypothetical protein
MDDYFNPSATRPTLDGGPMAWPGLMGFMAGEQRNQYNNFMDMQQQRSAEALKAFLDDRAKRDAQREAEIKKANLEALLASTKAKTPNYASSVVSGEIGSNKSLSAKGEIDEATAPSTISSTNAKNQLAALSSKIRQLELSGAGSAMMNNASWQQIYNTLDPELQKKLPSFYSPELKAQIDSMSKALVETPEHRAAVELQNVKDKAENARVATIVGGANQRNTDQLAASRTPAQTLNWTTEQIRRERNPMRARDLELQREQAAQEIAEEQVSKQFGKFNSIEAMMQRIQAMQKAKALGLDEKSAQEMADKAVEDWLKLRQTEKQRILGDMSYTRKHYTMEELRRFPTAKGKSDEEIRAIAAKRGLVIVE